MNNRNILQQGNWLNDYTHLRPRTDKELFHKAAYAASTAKLVTIEPSFKPHDFSKLYSELADYLNRILPFGDSDAPEAKILFEDVTSGNDVGKVRQPSQFHSDNFTKPNHYGLNLMVCVQPAERGGENEYATISDISDALRIQKPELFTRIKVATKHLSEASLQLSGIDLLLSKWNYKKLIQSDNSPIDTKLLKELHSAIENDLDLAAYLVTAPRTHGSATLWWDHLLIHRRKPESKIGLRHYQLHRIPVGPLFNTGPLSRSLVQGDELDIHAMAELLVSKKVGDAPLVVGIDGLNASGKTTLSTKIEEHLQKSSFKTLRVSIDDFHNAPADRYSEPGASSFYKKYFNFDKLVNELLTPIREGASINCRNNTVYGEADKLIFKGNAKDLDFVLLEGVFAFQSAISRFLDYKIYISSSVHDMFSDGISRWSDRMGVLSVLERFISRYYPAQSWYHKEVSPLHHADLVICRSGGRFFKCKI